MVKQRWATVSSEDGELAVCYELPLGSDGFHQALHAQQAVTSMLRQECGPRAEQVAVFAISDREGERLEDYVREWGATVVCA
jgi:hypothetical protein